MHIPACPNRFPPDSRRWLRWPLTLWLLLFTAGAHGQSSRPSEVDQLSDRPQQAMAAKDWPAAAQALEKLAQFAPRVAEGQAKLGLAYYILNRITKAAAAFERALKLDPRMEQARLLLGLCEAEMGHSEEALKVLEPAFGHPPDDELGRLIGFDLERAYTDQRRNDKALSIAEEMVKRYPNEIGRASCRERG